MSAQLNFLCLGSDPEIRKRCEKLSVDSSYSFLALSSSDEIQNLKGKYELIQFVLLSAHVLAEESQLEASLHSLRQLEADSFICVVASEEQLLTQVDLLQASGAKAFLTQDQLLHSSCLEYFASQIIRASYAPVKLNEFEKKIILDFTLYHLMPLNQKLIPVFPKGSAASEEKLKKLKGVEQLFVRRNELDRYLQYIESRPNRTSQGLQSRCRAQYLSYCQAHSQLIFFLSSFQNLAVQEKSAKDGKWLLERCENLAKNLLATLSAVGESWELVAHLTVGDFASVERATAISAYAGLLSLMGSISEPVEVMLAGLLSNVGLLSLAPEISRKIRADRGLQSLTEEELQAYQKYPQESLNICQSRKLQLSESLKKLILTTQEKLDGTGFPHQLKSSDIPAGSMLLQFSKCVDQVMIGQLGIFPVTLREAREQLFASELKQNQILNDECLQKLKQVI